MSEAVAVQTGLGGLTARSRWLSVPPVILLCFVIIGGAVFVAIFGRMIAPYSPGQQNVANVLQHASGAHWLGTDALGRDILSRILAGSRTALMGPIVIAAASMVIGNALGLIAGYRGGRVEALIMRWVDFMWAVPGLLIVIVVVGQFGGGYWMAVAVLLVLTIPFDTRVIRGATLEQAPRPYVEAAKSLGVSDRRIMAFHIWPNVSHVAVANTCLVFASSLVALSSLSYLGLGLSPGTADWGLMVAEERNDLFVSPIAPLAPALAIVVTATCLNLIGDWFYERLSSRGATR
jgi:peptide/nickel transport system permease protein